MHAVLIHGFKGWATNAWFPWLCRELESRDFTAASPMMPDPIWPRRDRWIEAVLAEIKGPDTILGGHSLGCLAILYALEAYEAPPIAGVVLVSGFARNFGFSGLETWIDRSINFSELRHHARSWQVLHSKDDDVVPYAEGEWLAKQLHTELTTTPPLGHLTHEEGVFEAPPVLEAVLKIPRV